LITPFFMKGSSSGIKPEDKEHIFNKPGTSSSAEDGIDDFLKIQSQNHSLHWYFEDNPGELKGVALVIHGLNLRPDKMQPIISELRGHGIDVLRLSLRGHGDNYSRRKDIDEDQARLEAFKNVSYQLWLNEAYLAYLQLKARGAAKKVPLFLTAFSLGGLIGLDLFASKADVKFDKLVLFAPAIRLRAVVYLERVLAPFPHLVIPTLAPEAYLANKKGTPVAAYNALFGSLDRFNRNADQKLNVPTLVFIDEQDEFIPISKLKKLVEVKKWNRWRFYIVEKDKSAEDEHFYHHIIDATSTGKTVWLDMMKAVGDHLLDQKPLS